MGSFPIRFFLPMPFRYLPHPIQEHFCWPESTVALTPAAFSNHVPFRPLLGPVQFGNPVTGILGVRCLICSAPVARTLAYSFQERSVLRTEFSGLAPPESAPRFCLPSIWAQAADRNPAFLFSSSQVIRRPHKRGPAAAKAHPASFDAPRAPRRCAFAQHHHAGHYLARQIVHFRHVYPSCGHPAAGPLGACFRPVCHMRLETTKPKCATPFCTAQFRHASCAQPLLAQPFRAPRPGKIRPQCKGTLPCCYPPAPPHLPPPYSRWWQHRWRGGLCPKASHRSRMPHAQLAEPYRHTWRSVPLCWHALCYAHARTPIKGRLFCARQRRRGACGYAKEKRSRQPSGFLCPSSAA